MTTSFMPQQMTSEKKERESPPTILAALVKSTPEERENDPKKADELAADLHEIMTRWAMHWEPRYLAADERWDFYDGRQWGYHSTALNMRVVDPPSPSTIRRKTVNYIRRCVDKRVSLILKDRPIIRCLAGTSEVIDRAASEAADDILDWRFRRTLLSADDERVARNADVAGWCWVHEEWDTSVGKMVPRTGPDGAPLTRIVLGEDGMPVIDPMTGAPQQEPDTVPEGDYCRTILGHRQGVPDPSAKTPFQGSAFFIRQKVSRFDFMRRYPDLDLGEYPADGDSRDRERTSLMGGTGPVLRSGQDGPDKDELEVCIMYAPKCRDYPAGVRAVFTERHLIEETTNPRYPQEGEEFESEPNQNEEPAWPVFTFVSMMSEGDPLGGSVISDQMGMQRFVNGCATSWAMHTAIAKGKWVVPDNLFDQLTNEEVQVLKVRARGFDPNTLKSIAPPMAPPYEMYLRAGKEIIFELGGLNQPSMGQQETTGQSGYSIRLRQQTADNDIDKTRERHNNMWACLYKHDLLLFRRNAEGKRKIEVVGENRRSALREFDRTALMPGTNVIAVNDAAIPRAPAERMVWLTQFMGTGVMQLPPDQRQEMFELMRLQDFKGFEDRKQGDLMRVERQIRRIMGGEEPGQVSEMDDHLVQMERIRQFALSEEFETQVESELKSSMTQVTPMGPMPGMAPPPQPTSPTFTRTTALYQAHKQAHMAQQAAMMPPPGGAPGPGGGPPVVPPTNQSTPNEAPGPGQA